jgi:Phosphodiester glycosidase
MQVNHLIPRLVVLSAMAAIACSCQSAGDPPSSPDLEQPITASEAAPERATLNRIVKPGIRYLFYAEARTPMHVVVVDRSHREYEFRVLAHEIKGKDNKTLFKSRTVTDLAREHVPQAIVAINGGYWECPELENRGRGDWRCLGWPFSAKTEPTGAFVTNGNKFKGAVIDEVVFGASKFADPGDRVAIIPGAAWESSASYHYYALGMPSAGGVDHYLIRNSQCVSEFSSQETRSAIGYGPNHIVLVSSDHREGADRPSGPDLCKFFEPYHVTDAMLLDSGHSAQMYVQGEASEPVNPSWEKKTIGAVTIKFPLVRRVSNAIGVVKACQLDTEPCSAKTPCCLGLTCQVGTCQPAAPPPAACGNGTREAGEACDGTDLNGGTCSALGFDDGALACSSACSFDTSGCCNDACSGGTICDGDVLLTCGNYDGDPCLEWGGGVTCPNGCSAGACQGPGPTCSTIYTQGFEDLGLFSDSVSGSQPFMAGSVQVGQFWDAGGFSRIRHGAGHAPSTWSLDVETHSFGAYDHTLVEFPVTAAGNEPLRVSFYAYNPLPTSYTIGLQRLGGLMVTKTVPPLGWTLISADLTSSFSATSTVHVYLGLIPNVQSGSAFRMDDVRIERCTQ